MNGMKLLIYSQTSTVHECISIARDFSYSRQFAIDRFVVQCIFSVLTFPLLRSVKMTSRWNDKSDIPIILPQQSISLWTSHVKINVNDFQTLLLIAWQHSQHFIRALFQYKGRLSRYKDSQFNDKKVSRPPYLYNGNSYTGKAAFYIETTLDTHWKILVNWHGPGWLSDKTS